MGGRLAEGRVRGVSLSSVEAETGALYELRSFDYEEVREVVLWVRAAPAAPLAAGAGWAGVELAPRSAEPGALVAKVVAVDADAGQNAWLSYELAKATEPGLLRVLLPSGEVRTEAAVVVGGQGNLRTLYFIAFLGCDSALLILSVVAFSATKLKAFLTSSWSGSEFPLLNTAKAGTGKDEEPLHIFNPLTRREQTKGEQRSSCSGHRPRRPTGESLLSLRPCASLPSALSARPAEGPQAGEGPQPREYARPLRYSVAEEGESGSVVGNVAEDAGLAPAQLSARRARLASEDGRQHFRLERGTGRLLVAERLDREELCGQAATCTLPFELVLANPLQFLRVEVTVEDINDHAPVFPEEQVTFKILETSNPGSRFPLEGARDLDIGSNSIQTYIISPENEYFSVFFGSHSDYEKYVELVLENPLDREDKADMRFSLVAMDGGSPPRSGNMEIHVVVLDVNDNTPVFTQRVYFGKVLENAPEGSVVLRVVATDVDVGPNGEITYQFIQAVSQSDFTFLIDPVSGEIRLSKPLDFEAAQKYELSVRASDGGGLSAICKVLVEVGDVNDNAPELVVSSFSSPLPENALPGTVVALFNVKDRDSGANGKISCALEDQLSFSLQPAYKNYYELVTVSTLDREETAQYILSVTAADAGSPPLTTTQTFTVDVSDVNDNAPVFNQTLYVMYVRENNVPTVLVGAVSAADADTGSNAKVTYSLLPAHPTEQPPCSCISVNSENGDVFVLRPLDYEQIRQVEVLVSASDTGSPPLSANVTVRLSSNVTVRLVVVDENDNAPLVLYPSQDSNPPPGELVPMSAEAGYLVTKVVAVDADSGQNSWLSYHLLRATDPGLFVVGAQSGEVRLRRPVTERDPTRQKLVVLVRDTGQPPLSATASLSALLLHDFSDVRLPHSSLAMEDEGDSLTMYLIISLVFVSLLFLAFMAAFVLRKMCKRKELKGTHVFYDAGNLQSSLADAATAGTLPHPYCYEISLTTGSGNSEFKFLKPILPSLPPQHCTMGRGTDDEQDFPRDPITLEDVAPDNPAMLTAKQFNSLSFK
nr:protocadherin beta-15-like [Columba livia]